MALSLVFVALLSISVISTSGSINDCDIKSCEHGDSPVCTSKPMGSSGHLYKFARNSCQYKCWKSDDKTIQMVDGHDIRQTPCCQKCHGSPPHAACASNGITFHHSCTFYCDVQSRPEGSSLTLIAKQRCDQIAPDCSHRCPSDEDHVCGSNGVTFKNQCYLECNQKVFPDLKLVSNETCESQQDSSHHTMTMTFDPSVTKYGMFYRNSSYVIQSPHWLICMVKSILQQF